jgi:hypothetical protein
MDRSPKEEDALSTLDHFGDLSDGAGRFGVGDDADS